MSDKYFVDTNILIYAHDASAGVKHERAKTVVEELWRDRSGVLSTQVLQELCVNLQRKVGRLVDAKAVREIATDYLTWQVVVNDGTSVLSALELQEKYQLSFWDALVVHAAQTASVSTLYSEDLADGQQYGGVHVENPLKAEASDRRTEEKS